MARTSREASLCVLPPARKGGTCLRGSANVDVDENGMPPIEAFHAGILRRGVRKKRHSWNQLGVNGAISRPSAREKSIRSRRRLCDTDFRIGHWRRSVAREKLRVLLARESRRAHSVWNPLYYGARCNTLTISAGCMTSIDF